MLKLFSAEYKKWSHFAVEIKQIPFIIVFTHTHKTLNRPKVATNTLHFMKLQFNKLSGIQNQHQRGEIIKSTVNYYWEIFERHFIY